MKLAVGVDCTPQIRRQRMPPAFQSNRSNEDIRREFDANQSEQQPMVHASSSYTRGKSPLFVLRGRIGDARRFPRESLQRHGQLQSEVAWLVRSKCEGSQWVRRITTLQTHVRRETTRSL